MRDSVQNAKRGTLANTPEYFHSCHIVLYTVDSSVDFTFGVHEMNKLTDNELRKCFWIKTRIMDDPFVPLP